MVKYKVERLTGKSKLILGIILAALWGIPILIGFSDYVQEETAVSQFSQPPVQFPYSGHVFEDFRYAEECAPLSIEMPSGGNMGYYFVVKPIYGRSELRFFARSGDVVEFDVPLGSYEIYYASGSIWYGEEYLFGPKTQYYRLDEQFDFVLSGNQYQGWTIELTQTTGGNLDEDKISAEDFPS